MAFSGQLGDNDALLGQIILGSNPESEVGAPPSSPHHAISGDIVHWVDGLPAEGVQNLTTTTTGLAYWVDGLPFEGSFTDIATTPSSSLTIRDEAQGLEFVNIAWSTRDFGSGSDDARRTPVSMDSGVGTETVATSAVIRATDIGRGLDQVNVDYDLVFFTAQDQGHGEDNGTLFLLTNPITVRDFGQGMDRFAGDADKLAQDAALGNEFVNIAQTTRDSGQGQDALGNLGVGIHDQGQGGDGFITNQTFQPTDTAQGQENVATSGVIAGSDQGHGTEQIQVGLGSSDTGHGTDSSSLLVTIHETGQGDDSVAVEVVGFINPVFASRCQMGPEIWLPSWYGAKYSTESNLYNLFQFTADRACEVQDWTRRLMGRRFLATAEVGETRRLWTINTSYPRYEDLVVRFKTATGSLSGDVRKAISAYDFWTAVDPVWWADPTDQRLILRNLMMRPTALFSFSGVYTISGVGSSVVPDVGIYWRGSERSPWEWLDPEDPNSNGSTFRLPATGDVLIAYGSAQTFAELSSGYLIMEWQGGHSIDVPLVSLDHPTIFDGYGQLFGIPRLSDEDNLTYKRRMLHEAMAPPDTALPGVVRGIASRLGQVTSFEWDGVTTQTLDTSGAPLGITALHVVGVPRVREITEQLTPSGTAYFYATYANWRPGALVTIDGVPEPNAVLSSNRIALGRATSGRVEAVYSIEQFTTSVNGSGYITALNAGTGLASGSYVVLLAHHVNAYTIDLPDVQDALLLTAAGLPNGLFLNLAHQLTADNQMTFGRARWGRATTWFDRNEERPVNARLPIPFDANDD